MAILHYLGFLIAFGTAYKLSAFLSLPLLVFVFRKAAGNKSLLCFIAFGNEVCQTLLAVAVSLGVLHFLAMQPRFLMFTLAAIPMLFNYLSRAHAAEKGTSATALALGEEYNPKSATRMETMYFAGEMVGQCHS